MKNNISIANDILVSMTDQLTKEQLQILSKSLSDNLQNCVVINETKKCETMEVTYRVIDKFVDFKMTYRSSKATGKAYKCYLYAFFRDSQVPLFYVTEEIIQKYLCIKSETISPTSVDNIRRTLSTFFSWCYDFGWVLKNPCTKNLVPAIKQPKVIRHDLSAEDMVRVKDAAREIKNDLKRYRAVALIDFLESTGCRVKEIRLLKIEDLDFASKRAKIHGKGEKERYVYLNASCIKHLIEYIDYKKQINKDSIYVFSNLERTSLNSPIDEHNIELVTKRLGKACGIDNLTVHIFRRLFATSNYSKGVDPDTLRLLMGHSQYQTTLRYINQNTDDVLRRFEKISR